MWLIPGTGGVLLFYTYVHYRQCWWAPGPEERVSHHGTDVLGRWGWERGSRPKGAATPKSPTSFQLQHRSQPHSMTQSRLITTWKDKKKIMTIAVLKNGHCNLSKKMLCFHLTQQLVGVTEWLWNSLTCPFKSVWLWNTNGEILEIALAALLHPITMTGAEAFKLREVS